MPALAAEMFGSHIAARPASVVMMPVFIRQLQCRIRLIAQFVSLFRFG
jgi:hypothetical protein